MQTREMERLTKAMRARFFALLHGARRFVALLRDDGIFHRLAFFVLQSDRRAFVVHQLHLDLAIGSIVRLITRRVSQNILTAQRFMDLLEDAAVFTLESGQKDLPASFRGES